MHESKSAQRSRLIVPGSRLAFSKEERGNGGRLCIRKLQAKAPPLSKSQLKLLEGEAKKAANEENPWDEWHTPLQEYSNPYCPKFNGRRLAFDEYLAIMAGNRLFRLLDVGTGSGMCWPRFLKSRQNIELYATSLDTEYVVPELEKMVVRCGADAIAEVFPPDFFDMVVSHKGMHGDEMETMIASQRILKDRGEAIFVGSWFYFSMPDNSKLILEACPDFELVGSSLEPKAAAYHFRKIA